MWTMRLLKTSSVVQFFASFTIGDMSDIICVNHRDGVTDLTFLSPLWTTLQILKQNLPCSFEHAYEKWHSTPPVSWWVSHCKSHTCSWERRSSTWGRDSFSSPVAPTLKRGHISCHIADGSIVSEPSITWIQYQEFKETLTLFHYGWVIRDLQYWEFIKFFYLLECYLAHFVVSQIEFLNSLPWYRHPLIRQTINTVPSTTKEAIVTVRSNRIKTLADVLSTSPAFKVLVLHVVALFWTHRECRVGISTHAGIDLHNIQSIHHHTGFEKVWFRLSSTVGSSEPEVVAIVPLKPQAIAD